MDNTPNKGNIVLLRRYFRNNKKVVSYKRYEKSCCVNCYQ